MINTDTSTGAPKTRRFYTVQQRSDMIRERVRDAVGLLGHRDHDFGKRTFARRALDVAQRRGLRTWRTDNARAEWTALSSLETLLEEKVAIRGDGTRTTGRNEHWVLDIWEAALAEMYHPPAPVKPDDPAADQLEDGIVVEAPEAPKPALAMRLVEAYIDRDEGRLIELAAEVEVLERERAS